MANLAASHGVKTIEACAMCLRCCPAREGGFQGNACARKELHCHRLVEEANDDLLSNVVCPGCGRAYDVL
eukprot:6698-Eustigmatos_ZCMA.PRE.1